ncbi:MAG: AraC family transcriptional regulator [Clostridiales bacterium]|nr:AraC family transcriptional regulator [Clostridiales bacterium]
MFLNVSHILESKHGRVSRAELESQTNYSGDHLNRIVKKYTGMTIIEYGHIFLTKEAERLLLQTDMSVMDISLELGFSNRSHFYKIFRLKHRMTPNEFRTAESQRTESPS